MGMDARFVTHIFGIFLDEKSGRSLSACDKCWKDPPILDLPRNKKTGAMFKASDEEEFLARMQKCHCAAY